MRASALLGALLFAACHTVAPGPDAGAGTLLLIGGGLDDDARDVYQRFVALAAAQGPARIVIATAATGPQDDVAIGKAEALRIFAPGVPVEVVRRETDTAATVAAFDRATAVFFTGGDQARITARYRPDGQPTPEWHALRRLLARGGVVAGASAGCAMMGSTMLLGGSSAEALATGPRLGPGMALCAGLLTDSHFFERDRLGRLVAALMAGPARVGLGVGELAAVEVDLATGTLMGLTAGESLLVDATHARRDRDRWLGLRARLVGRGDRLPLGPLAASPPSPWPEPMRNARDVPVVEPGQDRQLASWRLFRQAAAPGAGVLRLAVAGWQAFARADGAHVALWLQAAP